MGKRFLVALDTDHIKQFVFATDKLKEIRGASSILDRLNRRTMVHIAENQFGAKKVFANGGSGLFLVDGDEEVAESFGRCVQQAYSRETEGGASVTFAIQEVPIPEADIETNSEVYPYLQLLPYRLLQAKGEPHQQNLALPSHPLMRLCEACGTRYAEAKDKGASDDPEDQERRYCQVCLHKRVEDYDVKKGIEDVVAEWVHTEQVTLSGQNPFAWAKLIAKLPHTYKLAVGTDRPSDFNKFQKLSNGYIGLIYADANNMGTIMEKIKTIQGRHLMADVVDNAIYTAMSKAIAEHLPPVKGEETPWMFPFDILMIGGDDVMVVTPADVALDVALTLAKTFHEETKEHDIRLKKEGCTLSVGVVLAPVKYPFGLLQDLAESTLKFAKKAATQRSPEKKTSEKSPEAEYGETLINFMTVTGSNSLDFAKVYGSLHDKRGKVDGRETKFYATLRPYTVEELSRLLEAIRTGKQKGLGRTKLHQVREAVLHMNLTTSVSEGLALLNSWRGERREFVVKQFYEVAGRYQDQHRNIEKPGTLFPRVTFPWFADGSNTYRSPLLDFVELYDFVAQKEVENGQ